jgi:hypothetical protein
LETALSSSPALYSMEIDPELRPFFEKLFARPEITDLVWLNMYRVMSTRIGRKKPFLPVLLYTLPVDKELINEFCDKFKQIAEKHQIDNDFGFITPIDNGKRCIFEYDYLYDYNDPEEIRRIRQVGMEANMLVDEYSVKTGVVKRSSLCIVSGILQKRKLYFYLILKNYHMTFKNKPVIALTGATGFLGSHLMAGLITKGYNIIVFGRPAKNESLQERIFKLLKWFGVESMSDQVTCIDTDLSQDNLGISNNEYSRLCSLVDSVIHCASDTSFSESKREKVMAANINNLKGNP